MRVELWIGITQSGRSPVKPREEGLKSNYIKPNETQTPVLSPLTAMRITVTLYIYADIFKDNYNYVIQVIRISQGQILRSSRERVLTGLVGGLSKYLGLSPGVSRLIFLAIFAISIFVGLWLLFLVVYMLVSAVIPRDDDPEDLRAKGFVIKVDRLILSLIALILLGIGIAVLIYSLALLGMSFGINIIGLINPPVFLAGILAFVVAVLGIIAGLAITWLGFQFAKRV